MFPLKAKKQTYQGYITRLQKMVADAKEN